MRAHHRGHTGHAGIGPVRGAESVIDVNIHPVGQLHGERVIALFLGVMETQILQHQHLARLHFRLHVVDGFTYTVERHENHVAVQQLLQAIGDRLQAEPRISPALRPAEMRRQNHCRAFVQQMLDRGQSRLDAGVVGDLLIFIQRHVEIDAHKDALAFHVDVVQGFLVHRMLLKKRDA